MLWNKCKQRWELKEKNVSKKKMLYLNGSKLWKTKCLGCYVWYFDKRQICMVKKLTKQGEKIYIDSCLIAESLKIKSILFHIPSFLSPKLFYFCSYKITERKILRFAVVRVTWSTVIITSILVIVAEKASVSFFMIHVLCNTQITLTHLFNLSTEKRHHNYFLLCEINY